MNCVRTLGTVSRTCRNPIGAPVATPALYHRHHVRAAASGSALVVGGGFAGLAAAQVLTDAGVEVTLVEQGRGLGGRMCTRTVTLGANGERVTFDHGCQYLTPRNPLFEATLNDLQQLGALAPWGRDRPVGTAQLAEDGTVDQGTFAADSQKALWVGTPTNSTVGRALAARAGPRLTAVTATRVEELRWDQGSGTWRCRVRQGSGAGAGANLAAAKLESTPFDYVVTAMSSVSTVRLLGASGGGASGGGGGGAGTALAPEVVEAAGAVRSNVCWALMVALNKRIDVPYDGVLLSRPTPVGGSPSYGPIAWVARDSSKPGRTAVAGGAGEAWVVHGGPDWSNERRDLAPDAVAQELLRDFAHLVQVPISPSDVVHLEAHRWNNAYPLNPRPPQPTPQRNPASGSTSQLPGHYMLRPELKLGVCGDWCKGPRAADAYLTGHEAAHALLQL